MVDAGTENGGNTPLTEKIAKRISLVKSLQDAGYKTAVSIAKKLKEKGYGDLDISENTIRRDIKRIREEGRDFIENRVLTGEFIIDHHEALLELQRIADRCSQRIAEAKEIYEKRLNDIDGLDVDDEFTEAEKMRLKVQADSTYNSVILTNERMLSSTTKDFALLASKTETVWSLKKWIKENNPQALERPEIQDIINNLSKQEKEQEGES